VIGIVRYGRCFVFELALLALVNFLTIYHDAAWRGDTNANLVTFDPKDGDGNVIADADRFLRTASENQHKD